MLYGFGLVVGFGICDGMGLTAVVLLVVDSDCLVGFCLIALRGFWYMLLIFAI